MASEDVSSLKKALINTLDGEGVDFAQVIELSSRLVRLDPDNVRFSVDAGLISRLGRELVAREETAVSELIKNAYDADATHVDLLFENAYNIGGRLTIMDDGHGMTRDQLINGFMRLSSTDKIHNPVSPLYKRQRAGRKGIGRFAAQRLGNRLTIISQSTETDTALRLSIDWNRFVSDVDLSSIASEIYEMPKSEHHGTKLVIDGLAEPWTDAAISRIYRYVADLIQPYPLSKSSSKPEVDPGFETELYRIVGSTWVKVAGVDELIYDYALAAIDAHIDSDGLGHWEFTSKQLALHEKGVIGIDRDGKEPYSQLKDERLKAYYYIYNSRETNYLPGMQNNLIKAMANERGGIRIYRNGFRVLPYGELLNDWLKLDLSSGRRWILPPHANVNFFGFVQVTDPNGTRFDETSSREGLIENEAFKELNDFANKSLKAAVLRIAEARERKRVAGQRNWDSLLEGPEARIKTAAQAVTEAAETIGAALDKLDSNFATDAPGTGDNTQSAMDASAEQKKQIEDAAKLLIDASETIKDAAAQQSQQANERIEELSMLRVLASLGIAIGEFTHELNHLFPPILLDAKYLTDLFEPDSINRQTADRLKLHIHTLRSYTAYFDRSVSQNARREIAPQELGVTLRNFHEVAAPAASRYGIQIAAPDVNGYDLFTIPMHPSEWVSILYNLFTNSRKAIHRASSPGRIWFRAFRDNEKLILDFCDNGDGIAQENEDRIFQPFYTTSTPTGVGADDQDEAIGTGLGLKILRDIVTSYNGEVYLTTPPEGYITCFRIELPAASDEDRERYDL